MRAGIAINVDMDIAHLTPGGGSRGLGTDPALLSRVSGLSVVNLTAAIGCRSDVTAGVYCGGAGCLRGNRLSPITDVFLDNITIAGGSNRSSRAVGWDCVNVTFTVSGHVLPPACTRTAGSHSFVCSET